ncbi:MAG: hypothetical protein KJ714_04235, partial [Euryarchaeota archaeon]|nr:hypothetical protein [Euryarchaeota archaeon]
AALATPGDGSTTKMMRFFDITTELLYPCNIIALADGSSSSPALFVFMIYSKIGKVYAAIEKFNK